MRASASGVSQALASGGRRPLGSGASRDRQGLRVSRGGSGSGVLAYVRVDLDSDLEAGDAIADVVEILEAAGYAASIGDGGRVVVVKLKGWA